jgi:hypothetical protein
MKIFIVVTYKNGHSSTSNIPNINQVWNFMDEQLFDDSVSKIEVYTPSTVHFTVSNAEVE